MNLLNIMLVFEYFQDKCGIPIEFSNVEVLQFKQYENFLLGENLAFDNYCPDYFVILNGKMTKSKRGLQ